MDIEYAQHQSKWQKENYFNSQIEITRLVIPWLLIAFGLVGNALILAIFLKRLHKRNSNAFCFCALAVCDTIALLFMLLRAMLKTELLSNMQVSCKLVKFLYHFSLQLSAWCMVLLTVDRLIAVTFVFKYPIWSHKLHVVKVFAAIVVLIFCINMHLIMYVDAVEKPQYNPRSTKSPYPFYYSRNPNNNQYNQQNAQYRPPNRLPALDEFNYHSRVNRSGKLVCNVSYEKHPFYYDNIYTKWDIFHAFIYGAIPFVIIFISNVVILLRLSIFRNQSLVKSEKLPGESKADKMRNFQLTVMLLTVSFAFLLLTSPVSIYMAAFYENIARPRIEREYIKVVLRYIGYVNNAINFYLYMVLSSEFRREFVNLFKCVSRGSEKSDQINTVSSALSDQQYGASHDNQELKPLNYGGHRPIFRDLSQQRNEQNNIGSKAAKNRANSSDVETSDESFRQSLLDYSGKVYKKDSSKVKLVRYEPRPGSNSDGENERPLLASRVSGLRDASFRNNDLKNQTISESTDV